VHIIIFFIFTQHQIAGLDGILFPALRQYLNVVSHFNEAVSKFLTNSIPVLTLSPWDENNGFPFPSENKKTQIRQIAQEELFPEARNLK